MKKTAIIAALLLLTISAFGQDGKSIYNKYSDENDVSAVFISPAMFKMIGRIPAFDLGGGDVDITPIVKSLKGFYLLDSSNASVSGRINADVKKLLSGDKFEMLMEAKDNGETIRIYTSGDDKIVNSLIMMAKDGDDTTFISMDGIINRSDLDKLLKSASL